MLLSRFDTPPLLEDIAYHQVNEGQYAVASANNEFDHLVTQGIYTCKAIALHSPATNYGLLAHLSHTNNAERSLASITEAYEEDITEADIHLVQATGCSSPGWPSLETIADFFMQRNPRSLRANDRGGLIRAVALDLESGQVAEVFGDAHLASNTWQRDHRITGCW